MAEEFLSQTQLAYFQKIEGDRPIFNHMDNWINQAITNFTLQNPEIYRDLIHPEVSERELNAVLNETRPLTNTILNTPNPDANVKAETVRHALQSFYDILNPESTLAQTIMERIDRVMEIVELEPLERGRAGQGVKIDASAYLTSEQIPTDLKNVLSELGLVPRFLSKDSGHERGNYLVESARSGDGLVDFSKAIGSLQDCTNNVEKKNVPLQDFAAAALAVRKFLNSDHERARIIIGVIDNTLNSLGVDTGTPSPETREMNKKEPGVQGPDQSKGPQR